MKPVTECASEEEVMAAALRGRWPERVPADLLTHLENCEYCRDLVEVAGCIAEAGEIMRDETTLPEAGRVWWVSQMRARREAIRTAGRPITAVQVAALGCAAGLAGACFGATSSWFQGALRWLQAKAGFWDTGVGPSFLAVLSAHIFIALGILAALIVLPAVLVLALGRD